MLQIYRHLLGVFGLPALLINSDCSAGATYSAESEIYFLNTLFNPFRTSAVEPWRLLQADSNRQMPIGSMPKSATFHI